MPRTWKSARHPSPRRARFRSLSGGRLEPRANRGDRPIPRRLDLRTALLCRVAGRMREQMHEHGFLGRRLRRLDTRGRQRERDHEDDEAGAHHGKEHALHDNHHRCNLRTSLNPQGRDRFPSFDRSVNRFQEWNWPQRGGKRRGHFGGVSWGLIRLANVSGRSSFPRLGASGGKVSDERRHAERKYARGHHRPEGNRDRLWHENLHRPVFMGQSGWPIRVAAVPAN